ncbi:scavenger receptor cysteine-rich type 1 protein M130-like [Polymixia lowei]
MLAIAILLLAWNAGVRTQEDRVRLTGGSGRCAGRVEVSQNGEWRPLIARWYPHFSKASAAVVCRQLGCGSPVLTTWISGSTLQPTWEVIAKCDGSEPALTQCKNTDWWWLSWPCKVVVELICSESVRLVNGSGPCSGRVEVKSDQSWASVCEDDFDWKDAQVVCREFDCGAPTALQGALYGEVEAPIRTKEFQCKGNESLLQDCTTSSPTRNTCSPGKAGGLTCSMREDLRLVAGSHSCAGKLEVKHNNEWRRVMREKSSVRTLNLAAVVCRQLGCGSVVLTKETPDIPWLPLWGITSNCNGSEPDLWECGKISGGTSDKTTEVICSESIRLMNGTSLCSGRVEVKSDQSWASVCENDFDWQDAEVVCRELACGPPTALQGALYGEVEAPTRTKEFQCKGNESLLQDCTTSSSTRNTCSPGKAAGLTCSAPDDVRLVGEGHRCAGRLEIKHEEEWRPALSHFSPPWDMKSAAVACRQLGCESALLTKAVLENVSRPVWEFGTTCGGSEQALRECGALSYNSNSKYRQELICSESVRLVNGSGLCSGRVEVKSDQSWASVCEDDFDWKDAQVVCRELACGAPTAHQGALYGEVEAPTRTKEFQCKGNESLLQDCTTSSPTRNTCSPGKAAGLTCEELEDVKLVGGRSRCAGRLQVRYQGEWRFIGNFMASQDLVTGAVVCRQLGCGSVVLIKDHATVNGPTWMFNSRCAGNESALKECGALSKQYHYENVELICSESVRLVNRSGLCSGRVEVKSDQSWASVCEGDFDWKDAEVVCREIGCGVPASLQGALYGDVKAPLWNKEFQCKGSESGLLDCVTSGSARNTQSPCKALELICSKPEDVRLSGGASRCEGTLEVKKHGQWRPLTYKYYWGHDWKMNPAIVVCRQLGCGPPVAVYPAIDEELIDSDLAVEMVNANRIPSWTLDSNCKGSESTLRECGGLSPNHDYNNMQLICSAKEGKQEKKEESDDYIYDLYD